MKIVRFLRSGFDALDIAFRGALPPATLMDLEASKIQSLKSREPSLVDLGPGRVEGFVLPTGKRGGYAYTFDTGPLGEIWFFKKGLSAADWNIFVSVKALSLATSNLDATWERLLHTLRDLGCSTAKESINRVDYAFDYLVDEISLESQSVVAHPRTTLRPHFGPPPLSDDLKPKLVMRGRQIESITIGQMPGRQIILYDKGREVRIKQKKEWFRIWELDPEATGGEILRVEVRAGKKHLKDRWNLTAFHEMSDSVLDVVKLAVEEIRYLDPSDDPDPNITRRRLHDVWEDLSRRVYFSGTQHRCGLIPSDVVEVRRLEAQLRYRSLIVGNLIPLCVAMGIDTFDDLVRNGSRVAADNVQALIDDEPEKINEAFLRAQYRLHFLV
jgi:hypothetical protein